MLSHVVMTQGINPFGVETSGRSEIINGAAGSSSTYPWIVPLADFERDYFLRRELNLFNVSASGRPFFS